MLGSSRSLETVDRTGQVSEGGRVKGLGFWSEGGNTSEQREFKPPWREAGPPNHHDDKVDSDQWVVNKKLSLSEQTSYQDNRCQARMEQL